MCVCAFVCGSTCVELCEWEQTFSTPNYFVPDDSIDMGDFTNFKYERYGVDSPEFHACNGLHDVARGLRMVHNLTRQYAFLNARTGTRCRLPRAPLRGVVFRRGGHPKMSHAAVPHVPRHFLLLLTLPLHVYCRPRPTPGSYPSVLHFNGMSGSSQAAALLADRYMWYRVSPFEVYDRGATIGDLRCAVFCCLLSTCP